MSFVLLAFAGTAASTIALHRYIHPFLLAVVADLLVFACICMLPYAANFRWAQSRWLLVAMLGVFFLEALIVYPVADARKYQGKGSNQDDALLQVATRMRQGLDPYALPAYGDSPISDGPGWAMLQIPVKSLRVYAFENPLILALIAWLLRRRSTVSAFLFVSSLFLMPTIHLLLSEGSDLPLLSAAIFLLCFTVYKSSGWATALWIVLCGCIATARINLIVLPFVFLFFRTDWRTLRAWLEALGSLAVGLLLHFIFYKVSAGHYAPLHLLNKGGSYLSYALPAMLVCGVLIAFLFLRYKAQTPADMGVLVGIFLLLSHFPLALGSAVSALRMHWMWEGYEYAAFCLVCLAAGAALKQGLSKPVPATAA